LGNTEGEAATTAEQIDEPEGIGATLKVGSNGRSEADVVALFGTSHAAAH
jgi:hypothetical protein